ncbi:MAG: HEAT repeat domain-containing protein, partial [Syntrophobacterales bacterium]
MDQQSENRLSYTARALLLGLLIAQVIATIQVYLSNLDLYRSLSAIQAAGFLTIPNQRTMSSLQDFGPAFLGGLFFTFSLGAGLSLLSLAAAWVWHRLFSRSRPVLIVLLLFWMGSVVVLNVRGFSIGATCYFLAIPPVVFLATLRWIPPLSGQRVWVRGVVHTIPVAVLALLWTSQLDGHLFVDFRDLVLLSNPVGTKINDFYYDYTLFPAEVFKSLEQKLLKTCSLRNFEKGSLLARVEKELLSYDYLNVGTNDAVDLQVILNDNMLDFNHGKRTILKTTPADFLAHPGAALHEFSAKSDKNGFFRQLTFRSLVIGLPLALYLILHALIRFVCCFFLDVRTSSLIASALCLIVGLCILIPFLYMRGASSEFENVPQALASESWQERIAALRIIEQKGLEVSSFQHYPQLLTSPRIAVRYWLVRGLAVSSRPETYRDLLAFLDDPHPNVVSMAFYGLGQRGNWRAVGDILTRIKTSDHWYNQWYA